VIGFLRLFVVGFVLLTILYFVISLYSRSVRREALEDEWDRERPSEDRDAFVAEGMATYERSLRRKLIWLVYVGPVVAALVTFYVINVD
jgi:Na+-transporting methylmalonyl-CoA/oxaloacetate decarboxylase gamma subunit